MIIGKMPKIPLFGIQILPKTKFPSPIFPIVGIPFTNRNAQIKITAKIEAHAASKNTTCMIFSEYFFALLYDRNEKFTMLLWEP